MASITAGASVERPSYSKIAATGLKPLSAQQNPINTENTQKHEITSTPRDGTNFVSPSKPSVFTPIQKKLVPTSPKDSKETGSIGTSKPEVHVYNVDPTSPPHKTPRALDGMLVPLSADEAGTQISSSSGSGKPPSLDGKSVTSGTTFALDEKESLRPDDSASVKATEDEDTFQPSSNLPGSRTGSDDGVRAFRDQLREISYMGSNRHGSHSQTFGHEGNPPQGVLYIPPQGSGVGMVPGSARVLPVTDQAVDFPPDPKLLEALDSPKDRIMVLKLEQDIVDFVKDAKESSLKLPQTNGFYRMLAHKLADYYMLGHIVDESTMAVRIYKTPNCRLPPPLTGIATPSTAASTPPPVGQQMKILRRGVDGVAPTIANGSGTLSKTTSENGESGNDDVRKSKALVTREEREAKYEAARKRIMGSAKPSESPEEPVERDDSRSSSAAGKRNNRKKQRANSDDDFEARSAYSAYYPVPFNSGGQTPPAYGFTGGVDSRSGQFSLASYGDQDTRSEYSQYGVPANNQWANQGLHAHGGIPNWIQNQQPGLDLSGDFQRAMSFQPGHSAAYNSNMQTGYSPAYGQQFNAQQNMWPQQYPYMASYPPQTGANYMSAYPNRAANHAQEMMQAYQFGQLPSQTFPGRPPNKLEHPLPGSYKSKHFNPNSQAFVPGQVNGTNTGSFPQQGPPTSIAAHGGYGVPGTLQPQGSGPLQSSPYGSPHPVSAMAGPARAPSQPMTHPLPQPVFPRQPTPNMPLPSRPEATPPKSTDWNINGSPGIANTSAIQNQSSIAKWGTPASLPAKPPPSAEPFDPARFVQAQRQPSVGSTRPPNSIPTFGSMPPMAGGYGASAQAVSSPRRI